MIFGTAKRVLFNGLNRSIDLVMRYLHRASECFTPNLDFNQKPAESNAI
ncbi:MAG: hypothetical protein JWO19_3629 [Bryobacterales bacterium]|nr:hypothetical protein [Bryobacterales bacterium]